jgi:hypothetical protein
VLSFSIAYSAAGLSLLVPLLAAVVLAVPL